MTPGARIAGRCSDVMPTSKPCELVRILCYLFDAHKDRLLDRAKKRATRERNDNYLQTDS
jgi:hypothetical protein